MPGAALLYMETAYTEAQGHPGPDLVESCGTPRRKDTGVESPTDCFLEGSATDRWIFQIAG